MDHKTLRAIITTLIYISPAGYRVDQALEKADKVLEACGLPEKKIKTK